MNAESATETIKSPNNNSFPMENVLHFAIQKGILSSKEETKMPKKSATVSVRIDPEIKTKAEAILSELGLPVSVAIDTLYRQIIITGGLPYSVRVKGNASLEDMSKEEFDAMMMEGHLQAENSQTVPLDEAFAKIKGRTQ